MVRQEHKRKISSNPEPIAQEYYSCQEFVLNHDLRAFVWIQKASASDFIHHTLLLNVKNMNK
jgi:hypothetical protein